MPRHETLQPVFLVGAARSGTSLLFRSMALHPDATWLSNWVQRFPGLPQLNGLNGLSRVLPARRSRVWFGEGGDNAYVYGTRRPLRDRLLPQPVEAETLYRRAGVAEVGNDLCGPANELAVERLRGYLETASRWDHRQVHVAKRIANNRRIPLLASAFPEARFVEIVRDGRAVAASLAKVDWWAESDVWWYGGNPERWREDGRDEWELCARNWVEEVRAVRDGLRSIPDDRVFSLTYEQLVSAPHESLHEVMTFVGLDPTEPGFRDAVQRIRFPNKNDRWRAEMDASVLAKVEAVQGQELRAHGYQLASLPGAEGAGVAER